MSLSINVDKIQWVLVGGGWNKIELGTFDLDAYEFEDSDGAMLLAGGSAQGLTSTGATWLNSDGQRAFCPVTAIQAVSY